MAGNKKSKRTGGKKSSRASKKIPPETQKMVSQVMEDAKEALADMMDGVEGLSERQFIALCKRLEEKTRDVRFSVRAGHAAELFLIQRAHLLGECGCPPGTIHTLEDASKARQEPDPAFA